MLFSSFCEIFTPPFYLIIILRSRLPPVDRACSQNTPFLHKVDYFLLSVMGCKELIFYCHLILDIKIYQKQLRQTEKKIPRSYFFSSIGSQETRKSFIDEES
jgi:hypothetical protein